MIGMNTPYPAPSPTPTPVPAIYRFKFDDSFVDILNTFSKVHQYDSRTDFKEAWKLWLEENNDAVETESRRLINSGYEGDIIDKMFKSARYYFRKKRTKKKAPICKHSKGAHCCNG